MRASCQEIRLRGESVGVFGSCISISSSAKNYDDDHDVPTIIKLSGKDVPGQKRKDGFGGSSEETR